MQARVYAGPLLLWDDALKKNPTSRMLHFNYGVDLMIESDRTDIPQEQRTVLLEEATRQFDEALKLDPRDERAWMRWGRSLLFLRKPQEALEKFDKALEIFPTYVDALVGRGTAFYEMQRYDESEKAFEAALASAQAQRGTGTIPKIIAATIYQYLGRIAVEKGDLDLASKQYAEAVNIVNDNSQIRYEYGMLLARLAKLADGAATQPATTRTATQVAAAPVTRPATTQAATQPSEKAKKLLAAAAANLAAAIEIRPDFVDARVALANLMMDVGNIGGARLQLEAAVRVAGNNITPTLKQAVERWDAEFRKREAAATRPTTTTTTTTTTTMPTTRAAATPSPRYSGERAGERGRVRVASQTG
jgi:tetratricopeptide (TPR) repeat protein